MTEYKVIFHIDELNKWKPVLGNVGNLLDGMPKEDLIIEVLANSEAVTYYDATQGQEDLNQSMDQLTQRGVKFTACNNALNAFVIQKDNLLHFVEVVPAGVVELVIRQSEGYAYIKP